MFISLEVLAAKSGLSQKFLRELTTQRRIPYLIVGPWLRYNLDEVVKALNKIASRNQK